MSNERKETNVDFNFLCRNKNLRTRVHRMIRLKNFLLRIQNISSEIKLISEIQKKYLKSDCDFNILLTLSV